MKLIFLKCVYIIRKSLHVKEKCDTITTVLFHIENTSHLQSNTNWNASFPLRVQNLGDIRGMSLKFLGKNNSSKCCITRQPINQV